MTIWLDEQLSPLIATWIASEFGAICASIYDVGLAGSEDIPLFFAAREARAVLMTKDRDLVDIVMRAGPPPQIIWLRCGNRSNRERQALLSSALREALELIGRGEPIVEIF